MDERDLRVGDWYVVAGEGPMQLVELPCPPITLSYAFKTDFGHLWHATPSQIIAEVDLEFVETFEHGYRAKWKKWRDPYIEEKRKWLVEMRTWATERKKNAAR